MNKIYLVEFHYDVCHTSIISAHSTEKLAISAALRFAEVNEYSIYRVSVLCLNIVD